jgi:hypothetical protein
MKDYNLSYKANRPYSNWKGAGKDPDLALGPGSANVTRGAEDAYFGGKTTKICELVILIDKGRF